MPIVLRERGNLQAREMITLGKHVLSSLQKPA